jgi:hypothetical protein
MLLSFPCLTIAPRSLILRWLWCDPPLCPGLNQSSDKRFSTHIGHGNPFLKSVLVQAAVCAWRKRGSYLKDKFFRLRPG